MCGNFIFNSSSYTGKWIDTAFSKDPDVSIDRAVAQLKSKKLLIKGDRMIVLSDILARLAFGVKADKFDAT